MGNFDTELYPVERPWCMFNVMMLEEAAEPNQGCFERDTVGRIHVDAFLASSDVEMVTLNLV